MVYGNNYLWLFGGWFIGLLTLHLHFADAPFSTNIHHILWLPPQRSIQLTDPFPT